MALFFHEAIKEREENHKRDMQSFRNLETAYNICYDILEEWNIPSDFGHRHGGTIASYGKYISLTLYRGSKDTSFEVEKFLQTVEEEIVPDFTVKRLPGASDVHIITYEYSKQESSFELKFYNSYCKKVKTGKLIEEEITVCNHS